MDNLSRYAARPLRAAEAPPTASIPDGGSGGAAPLLEVLWRRRWSVLLCVVVCLGGAAVYLRFATPVYRVTAQVSVEPNAPRVMGDAIGTAVSPSEGFLQTEAEAFQSRPVLGTALEAVQSRTLRTFDKVPGDAVNWLKESGALKVEVARKSDVIAVSMDSHYPTEAAALVNAVVAAYTAQVTQEKKSTGAEIVRALQAQRDVFQERADARLRRMADLKKEHRVLSFKDDRSNPVLERAATLSRTLSDAEIAAIDLRAQRDALRAAMNDPAAMSTLIESQQLKVKESGDKEYDDLRSQLSQTVVSLSAAETVLGPNHPRIQATREVVATLQRRIADKERAMASAQLLAVTTQLQAAEQKERDLRTAMESQRDEALDLNPAALEYTRAEADAQQLQKQLDLIDGRIAEVSVNNLTSRALNVRTIDPARAEDRPVKPARTLTLAVALMAGLMLGTGFAVFREHRDARLRNPQEILARLNVPVIATIPRVNPRLSPVIRGQIVRLDAQSLAAEAYRSVRTSLHLGVASEARTVLVASPGQGDGKSTTASNLAIAFAQSGERTLLIDCDLREPVQHTIFQIDGKAGLTTAVSGDTKLIDALQPTRVENLHLLPCGPLPPNPSELLASRRFQRMMQVLSKTFDRIVIDSPPLIRFTDAAILAAAADVTLLVLRLNQSMLPVSEAALERLDQVGARVLGTVANGGTADAQPYYGRSWQYARPSAAGQLVGTGWAVADRQVASRPVSPTVVGNAEEADESESGDDGLSAELLNRVSGRNPSTRGDALTINEGEWLAEPAG